MLGSSVVQFGATCAQVQVKQGFPRPPLKLQRHKHPQDPLNSSSLSVTGTDAKRTVFLVRTQDYHDSKIYHYKYHRYFPFIPNTICLSVFLVC